MNGRPLRPKGEYYLGQLRQEHIILERQRVAERWRSERWDSLTFQSPNWNIQLPGFSFEAADPDAFASRDDVLEFIESYAAFIRAPLRCGLAATVLRQKPDMARLIVETQNNCFEAKNMVIATGPFQVPAASIPIEGAALHLHSSRYRNPRRLPPGAVLVIGSGNSGVQIAEELCLAGRRVYPSVSKHRRMPRRYRGKDYNWWYLELGDGETALEQQPNPQAARLITGVSSGHDVDLRRLAADGVVLLGRTSGWTAATELQSITAIDYSFIRPSGGGMLLLADGSDARGRGTFCVNDANSGGRISASLAIHYSGASRLLISFLSADLSIGQFHDIRSRPL